MDLFSNPNFVAIVAGAGAFAVLVLIWVSLVERDPLADRLKTVTQRRNELKENDRKKNPHRERIKGATYIKRAVTYLKLTQGKSLGSLRLSLQRAGYHASDAVFAFLLAQFTLLIALGLGALFMVYVMHAATKFPASLHPALVLGGAAFGWVLPGILLKNQTQKRQAALRKGMPDALDLIVICAEAGLSLDASFDRVGREIGPTCPELSEEIGLTGVELNLLPDRHKALQGLSERVGLPSVSALVNTLIQTEKYGTPLSQALRVLSVEMRGDRVMEAEEKAARLPAMLTVPMILFILPPLFVVIICPAAVKVINLMSPPAGGAPVP